MSLASQINLLAQRIATEINKRGVPTGGTTGQVLSKSSGTNFATGWSNPVAGAKGDKGDTGATGAQGPAQYVESTSGNKIGNDWRQVGPTLSRNTLIDLHLVTSNYDYTLLIWVERSVYNSTDGSTFVLAQTQRVNNKGYGTVSLSVQNGALAVKVDNASAFDINYEARFTKTGYGWS